MEIRRVDGLEIEQDLAFQRRSWAIQRVGWVLMGAVVVAALAGLLGSGPLSRGRADAPGLMTVEYQRFARFESSEDLIVRLEPAATAGEVVRVSLNHAFLASAKLESVQPPPARVEAGAGRLVYVFAVAEPRVPFAVRFSYQPRTIGTTRIILGLESAPEPSAVNVRQLVYP